MFNDENVVLCASSAYDKKFYLNEDLLGLTEKELNVINQDDETLNALFKADFEKVSKKRNMKS